MFCCKQEILEWHKSRSFLYWRLRRLLLEDEVTKKVMAIDSSLSQGHIYSMLSRWFIEAQGTVNVSNSMEGRSLLFIAGELSVIHSWGGMCNLLSGDLLVIHCTYFCICA